MSIKEFTIEEAIIHVLDTGCDDPILNERCLNLNKDDINLFITKHLEKILKDDELFLGEFISEPSFIGVLNQFLNGEEDLINTSKEISQKFFEVLYEYGGSNSCDLLFLKIKTEIGDGLCMLKLDYIKNYTHKIEYDNDSHQLNIDIISQLISLPNSSQKVMKACLFLKDLNGEFNVMFLDKPCKNSTESVNYFRNEFLKCEKVHSSFSKTKELIEYAEKWTRKNIKDDADKAFSIREKLREKLTNNERVNVNIVAREVFEDKSDIDNFIDFVELNGIDGDVCVDKEYVNKKYERIRLKIDKDIDLYVNNDSFYDPNRFEVKRNGDGSLNITIKYILNYHER